MIKFALLLLFLNAQDGRIEDIWSLGLYDTDQECTEHKDMGLHIPANGRVKDYQCLPIAVTAK